MTDARYAQYENLLHLLILLETRSNGIGLADIQEVAGVQRRAAERMRDVLVRALPIDELRDGTTKRWRLRKPVLRNALAPTTEELTAIRRASALLEQQGDSSSAVLLSVLFDKLQANLTPKARPAFETDLEVSLATDRILHRPGPRENLDEPIIKDLREAILGGNWVKVDLYRRARDSMSWRNLVGPMAFLLGEGRQYLVGFSDHRQRVQLYRLAELRKVRILQEAFVPPEGFDINAWLSRSFGTWQEEPEQVEWQFAPSVAEEVKAFRFHPSQSLTENPDGSISLRFTACGIDEMCWHLFRWGRAVRIVAPERLRRRYEEMLSAAADGLQPSVKW